MRAGEVGNQFFDFPGGELLEQPIGHDGDGHGGIFFDFFPWNHYCFIDGLNRE